MLTFKILTKRERVLKGPEAVEELGVHTDKQAVKHRRDNCSDVDTLEAPKSEEDEGEQDADYTACDVVGDFEFVDIDFEFRRKLFNEKLVCLGRDVGAEKERDAEAAKEHSQR